MYKMASSKDSVLNAAKELISFINKSPSAWHAVEESRSRLVAHGFKELKETDHWQVNPLDKCFVTRNQSTLIAFAVGGQYKAGNGFSVVGAHTDSPCLKVKPVSKKTSQGYQQVSVECYGGGSWHTWTDRDLTVAGRVLVRNGTMIEHRLVHINRPILRVPNIAIHLHRELGQKFEFNKETHLVPVLATQFQEELNVQTESNDTSEGDLQKSSSKHSPLLIKALCSELNVPADNILDFELCLADCQPATVGGFLEEFIFAPRLDNLHSSFCAITGLINSCGESLAKEPNIRMVSLFDNEEVGSESAQGAASMLQEHILRRLSPGQNTFEEAIPKSMMVSADMAHAVHPNYSDKHEDHHRPNLHKGIVVKFNCNQRYATTAITTTILREVARIANVPLQDFVVRNDSPCGSTIGPIMSARLGIPTVDIGAPQLSMHSIREMCGTTSVLQGCLLFQNFFEHYSSVFNTMSV